ncbi:hypothetical protein TAMA11512_08490 [Selenomonas sp. TAMA-11512]|uniref:peptidase U32 family protein n=1 Tax=Selenomonas sp. TAMA-11512 TaxID=3095337 RepID=UPI003086C66E|nr:hypothetical protein TAMA11512_08490 [Selenomonas sp. TAMA-11512]
MLLHRKSVELLAPAGTFDALIAGVDAGADAIYLGGKHFNMRLHEGDFNFDNEMLKKAVEYTHERGVQLYITLNNLISEEEVEPLKEYLQYLNEIKPDAILVQDFAVLALKQKLGIDIPIHTSVMMNTHNEGAIEKMKEYGITRIVVGREMTLSELSLFKERTGLEIEYFMHGDMCISESGQCIHSGVLFGQSGNRGRCLKACRWAFQLIDEDTEEVLDADSPGPYKLALKDMCMYRNIPDLIQAGVYSFKIEGRMRPPEFIRRIVSTYRKEINAYIDDPMGYTVDEEGWQALYQNRARDFTTTFALGKPTAKDIGFDGTREPRFFSEAREEALLTQDAHIRAASPIADSMHPEARLSVRVSTIEGARKAIENGAETIYIGGEAFKPHRPWKLKDIETVIEEGHAKGVHVVLNTPRTTMRREFSELEQFLAQAKAFCPDGILVSNLGSLRLAAATGIPLFADHSFNLFNHEAAGFLQTNGAVQATSSYELSFGQLARLVRASDLPIEAVVHGSYESMILDHNLPAMSLGEYNHLQNPAFLDRRYALKDSAGEIHSLRIDQFERQHLYFGKDLCLYSYLAQFTGIASYRLELHDYEPALVALVTKTYREALDALRKGTFRPSEEALRRMQEASPRTFGLGVYRFRESRNSI